jgi:PTS system N-acetylglucosamine-specific IIC component
VATSRLRVRLADGQGLSESQLKALGCQGVSPLDGGVWHLLLGEKAPGLWRALEAVVLSRQAGVKA